MTASKGGIFGAIALLILFLGVVVGMMLFDTEHTKTLDAKFDQTVTYSISPDGDKMEDGAMYGIDNLKLNQAEGYYMWKEHLKHGGSVDETVDTKYDKTSEVTVIKDLKEADAHPMVEHQIVYMLNREAVAKNKEIRSLDATCVKGDKKLESYVYPTCKADRVESARFVKHHYIIHIPENSDPANYR